MRRRRAGPARRPKQERSPPTSRPLCPPRRAPLRVRLVGVQLALERRELDPEIRRRARPVATCTLHRREDVIALDVLEPPGAAGATRARHRAAELLREVVDLHPVPSRERDGVLDRVLDLADVPRPLVPEDCYDNAAMESWFSTLKSELGQRFETHASAKDQLFDYIEVFYNQQRMQSALGYASPAEFERAASVQLVA